MADLTNWIFLTDAMGTIIDANFASNTNADGYYLSAAALLLGVLRSESSYNICNKLY
ncbi:hypothetical protein [Microcystis aeruginosa]|uniref:hypothetical protein n=1 Tax=Microcystis aeruginosa TaxID=1126 RepID=UPI00232BD6C8|nr:hypothetical protein [Microcystis aeruginosa]MDB9389590.1 hypothetical protein [Microcystis aeruginosa CS-579]